VQYVLYYYRGRAYRCPTLPSLLATCKRLPRAGRDASLPSALQLS